MANKCLSSENYRDMLIPVRDALDVIKGKWRIQIVVAIKSGCNHFNEIQEFVEGISPKMLSKELKELEQHRLVIRTVENKYPAKISYHLNEYAKTLTPILFALREWGKQHRARLFPKEQENI